MKKSIRRVPVPGIKRYRPQFLAKRTGATATCLQMREQEKDEEKFDKTRPISNDRTKRQSPSHPFLETVSPIRLCVRKLWRKQT